MHLVVHITVEHLSDYLNACVDVRRVASTTLLPHRRGGPVVPLNMAFGAKRGLAPHLNSAWPCFYPVVL